MAISKAVPLNVSPLSNVLIRSIVSSASAPERTVNAVGLKYVLAFTSEGLRLVARTIR